MKSPILSLYLRFNEVMILYISIVSFWHTNGDNAQHDHSAGRTGKQLIQSTQGHHSRRSSRKYHSNHAELVRYYAIVQAENIPEEEDSSIFDLQEVLDHFATYCDIRYLEHLNTENMMQAESQLGEASTMRVYDKKMVLDKLVDHFEELSNRDFKLEG